MRTPLIAGNWKMHCSAQEAAELIDAMKPKLARVASVGVVICPPYTALHTAAEHLRGTNIALGAQNCYPDEGGAYTGEIAPRMLLELGCSWCIVGHSERRQLFGESDKFLNQKMTYAVAAGLNVMFCIGETLEERESGEMESVLRRQVTKGLEGLDYKRFQRLVVAYEPVWAIGTGKTASPEQAEEAHAFIRRLIANQFGETAASELRIQYGGSVKPENAADLLQQENVDGALVGGASLDAASFAAIVDSCS